MKKSRYTEEQIMGILKQHEAEVKTADLCREHWISAATSYGWKQKFGGMDVSEVQRLKARMKRALRIERFPRRWASARGREGREHRWRKGSGCRARERRVWFPGPP
jgi:putative transposase